MMLKDFLLFKITGEAQDVNKQKQSLKNVSQGILWTGKGKFKGNQDCMMLMIKEI